jgi:outer membrane murein-binding lipoprotein Lpp
MGKSIMVAPLVGSLALLLASCHSPDRADYLAAAEQHTNYARIASEGAQANEAAARSFAAQGDEAAAKHAEEYADQFRSAYRIEHFQASKDRWLGQWWPSF